MKVEGVIRHYLILVFIMWFRRLSLFEFCGSFIYSFMHQFIVCLWVFTLPPILFCFLPLSLPSLSGKWRSGSITSGSVQVFCHRVAQPVPLMLLIESWQLWMLHLPQDVMLSIEIPGAVPCCLDDFLRNVLESLKKGDFWANRIN